MNPPAVLLGGANNAVSVARSLGRAGVEVHALGSGAWDPVRHSRHCRAYTRFPRDARLQQRWLAWLERHAARLPGSVLLACDDEGLELVARHRARLLGLGYRPFEADDRVLLAMLDKERTYEIARAAGVPAPRTVTIRDEASLAAAAATLGFPCALKPLHSQVLARHRGWGKVLLVDDAEQLARVAREMDALGVEVLATEIVPGPDDRFVSYYSYLDAHGEPLFRFTKRKLRGHPPGFGLTTYHAATWDDEVAAAGERFFRAAGVRGLANVEFKRDPRDGALKLIECNHRFTAANELLRLAGLDLPLLAYERALGRPGPRLGPYRVGMRLWSPVEDVRAFRELHARGELSAGGWLRSLFHRPTHMPLLRWDDPRPAVIHASRALRALRSSLEPRPPAHRPDLPPAPAQSRS